MQRSFGLRKMFVNAKPYKHLVIENFLDEWKARQLLGALKKEKFEEKDSDLFQFRQTGELKFSKNKVISEFNELMRIKISELIEEISGLKLKRKIDMAGSLYIDTDYLLCHDDKLEKRKIAYVYYLCDFKEEDGAAFVLFKDKNGRPWKAARKYLPKWNSLLIFEVTKKSWHEVEEVIGKKKRYAIGGWFY